MSEILTWQERITTKSSDDDILDYKQNEIDELRAALADREAKLAAMENQEPFDWIKANKEADAIVRSKPTWKRFIDGTPLSNDISVWMANFAESYAAASAAPVPEPEGWQPIETAPKDGVELIGWRKDCGAILIRWTSCSELMTEPEIEQSGIDDATLFSEDWFCAGGRLEGCEIPTHWMSLPAAPKEQP